MAPSTKNCVASCPREMPHLLNVDDIEHRIPWDTVATVDSGKVGHVTRDLINSTYEDPSDPNDQVATS